MDRIDVSKELVKLCYIDPDYKQRSAVLDVGGVCSTLMAVNHKDPIKVLVMEEKHEVVE